MAEQNFVVEMQLDDIPDDAYRELGQAEIDYTQAQMANGKLTQLLVSTDHKQYWMVFAVRDEDELLEVLEGFPLHDYFEYTVHEVMDMVAATEAGLTEKNPSA